MPKAKSAFLGSPTGKQHSLGPANSLKSKAKIGGHTDHIAVIAGKGKGLGKGTHSPEAQKMNNDFGIKQQSKTQQQTNIKSNSPTNLKSGKGSRKGSGYPAKEQNKNQQQLVSQGKGKGKGKGSPTNNKTNNSPTNNKGKANSPKPQSKAQLPQAKNQKTSQSQKNNQKELSPKSKLWQGASKLPQSTMTPCPEGIDAKIWQNIIAKHGKKHCHFQQGAHKATTPNFVGKGDKTNSKVDAIAEKLDTSHQIRQIAPDSLKAKMELKLQKQHELELMQQTAAFDLSPKQKNQRNWQPNDLNNKQFEMRQNVNKLGKQKQYFRQDKMRGAANHKNHGPIPADYVLA